MTNLDNDMRAAGDAPDTRDHGRTRRFCAASWEALNHEYAKAKDAEIRDCLIALDTATALIAIVRDRLGRVS